MLSQLLQPQEIEVYYVIPTIRRYFAGYMKENGASQKEIAQMFMMRESTVSQYIHSKRASLVTFPQKIEESLQTSALRIKTHLDLVRETQRIIHMIRESGVLCHLHKKFSRVKLDCGPGRNECFMGGSLQNEKPA